MSKRRSRASTAAAAASAAAEPYTTAAALQDISRLRSASVDAVGQARLSMKELQASLKVMDGEEKAHKGRRRGMHAALSTLSQLEASVAAAVELDAVAIGTLREQEATLEAWAESHASGNGEAPATSEGLMEQRRHYRKMEDENKSLRRRVEQLHTLRNREEGALVEAFKRLSQQMRALETKTVERVAEMEKQVRKLQGALDMRARTEAALVAKGPVDYATDALDDKDAEIDRLRQLLAHRDRTIVRIKASSVSNLKVAALRERVVSISAELRRLHAAAADESVSAAAAGLRALPSPLSPETNTAREPLTPQTPKTPLDVALGDSFVARKPARVEAAPADGAVA